MCSLLLIRVMGDATPTRGPRFTAQTGQISPRSNAVLADEERQSAEAGIRYGVGLIVSVQEEKLGALVRIGVAEDEAKRAQCPNRLRRVGRSTAVCTRGKETRYGCLRRCAHHSVGASLP
jgi:hypothetical protein